MATYFNDCSSLSDWTEEAWAASAQFTTASGLITFSGTTVAEALSLTAVSSDSARGNAEILIKWQTDTLTTTVRRLVGVRVNGTSDFYMPQFRSGATGIRVHKRVGGTNTEIASETITLATNTWYWTRFRVNGSDVKSRTWADGGSEPGTWGAETTDSDISGTTGNRKVALLTPVTAITVNWDTVGVGTNGDTAPSSAGGGYTHPTLSNARMTSLTSTSGIPNVDYAF